jgi:hypothetical protein
VTPLEIDPAEIARFYAPLADHLIQKAAGNPRIIIGIAGPPGSGKTAFASLLAAVINVKIGQEAAVSVGLDGWHYPNSYLDTNWVTRDGVSIPMRQVKGAPETYDTASALVFLRAARQGDTLPYPQYSRALHDPIPSGGSLTLQHRLIIVEGNYLLLNAPGWQEFHPLFDISIFINAPRADLVTALRARHIRGGKDPDAADKHLQFSDLPNLDLILSLSKPADILVNKTDSCRIEQVIYHQFI